MPAKGTKKVKGHIRQKTMFKFGNVEVKDPFSTNQVKKHFRKTPKRRNR
ncbi:MAG: hypothetical protein JW771_03560 [Candidatus Thermoplasmatota archaeon]|nr:hypothetical protein [Candidatus Thermoplasmatota archaeon]